MQSEECVSVSDSESERARGRELREGREMDRGSLIDTVF